VRARLAGGLLAVLAIVAAAPAAGADAGAREQVSPNWSGYAATARSATASFTSVSGEWVEPKVTCRHRDAGASSAVWVGLGGLAGPTGKVQQVGTDANCDDAGRPVYYAWFEVVPFPAYTISRRLEPGDAISASVSVVPGAVAMRVTNRTRHWTFLRKISWSTPDTSSAEWIVEAPAACKRFDCKQAALANFGSVRMTKVGAVAGSSSGTLTSRRWSVVRLKLVPAAITSKIANGGALPPLPPGHVTTASGPPRSPAGAKATETSADGRSFTIAWVRSATSR
jgi:hypothetical protein